MTCEAAYGNQDLSPDQPKKYYLDVLAATKVDAVNYLRTVAGIKLGAVAGDSGNDIDMLLETGDLHAILVGGAKSEAVSAIQEKTVGKEKGKRSFRKIMNEQGHVKACYTEPKEDLLGPESIIRALKILNRAENIKKIREEKEKQES